MQYTYFNKLFTIFQEEFHSSEDGFRYKIWNEKNGFDEESNLLK